MDTESIYFFEKHMILGYLFNVSLFNHFEMGHLLYTLPLFTTARLARVCHRVGKLTYVLT